ncbi:Uncharacterised protein [Mycolicibacterium smegmatis]|nr:Uncharacterised protein [Mycolicibacterium smegmatis]
MAFEEGRGPRGPPRGVHHQVGVQRLFGTAGPVGDPHAGDASAVAGHRHVGDVVAVEDLDVAGRANSLAHMCFQEWATAQVRHQRAGEAHGEVQGMTAEHHRQPVGAALVEPGRPVGGQFVEEAREQRVECRRARTEQAVDMPALRDPASLVGAVGQHVTFHHGDGVEVVREHPRGQQTAHAGTQNDCLSGHGRPPFEGPGGPFCEVSAGCGPVPRVGEYLYSAADRRVRRRGCPSPRRRNAPTGGRRSC